MVPTTTINFNPIYLLLRFSIKRERLLHAYGVTLKSNKILKKTLKGLTSIKRNIQLLSIPEKDYSDMVSKRWAYPYCYLKPFKLLTSGILVKSSRIFAKLQQIA